MDYDRWLETVFNPPAVEPDPGWPFDEYSDEYTRFLSLTSTDLLELVRRTFENSGRDLARYTDEQLAEGLQLLMGEADGEPLRRLSDAAAPVELRRGVIDALYPLYRDCFAKRCADETDAGSPKPLDMFCFMLWDATVLCYEMEEPVLVDAVFELFEKVLTIPHRACRESTLHGLGHWHFYGNAPRRTADGRETTCKKRVKKIIDDFLKNTPDLDPDLRKYALQAKDGNVL